MKHRAESRLTNGHIMAIIICTTILLLAILGSVLK